jgi:hypothetical protein
LKEAGVVARELLQQAMLGREEEEEELQGLKPGAFV